MRDLIVFFIASWEGEGSPTIAQLCASEGFKDGGEPPKT